MKKLVSLCLAVVMAVLLTLPGAAAEKALKIGCINTYWKGELRQSQVFSYDKKGRVSTVELWSYDEEEPTCSTVTCTYDKKGNLKKLANDWGEGIGEEYRYTHKYNSRNQITKTTGKLVAVSPDEEDYVIWEDSTTFKYDKSKRLVKKTRDYYGTVITTEYAYGNGYTVVTERAMDGEAEVNCNTCYYEPGTAPLRISFNDDDEFIVCHELLADIAGIYLDDCTYEYDDNGNIELICEENGEEMVEIVYSND